MMNETEFLTLAEQVLDHIESQADDWAAGTDLDIEASRNGNVLTLVFGENAQIVINTQAAMQEIWVAARSGGFHYRLQDGHWRDTRGGPDLPEALSQIVSNAAGEVLTVKL